MFSKKIAILVLESINLNLNIEKQLTDLGFKSDPL